MLTINESRRKKWANLLESLDMKQNSRRALKLIHNISRDPTKPLKSFGKVTANQVASQLIKNSKTGGRKTREPTIASERSSETHVLREPFTIEL